jgi:hypothetical protein
MNWNTPSPAAVFSLPLEGTRGQVSHAYVFYVLSFCHCEITITSSEVKRKRRDSDRRIGFALVSPTTSTAVASLLTVWFKVTCADIRNTNAPKKVNSVARVRERLYRPSDRHLSAKLVSTFADRGCHVVNMTDPYGRILGFLDRIHNFFSQVTPQLYSRGWVDPVPDPLLLRKSGNVGNRTRISVSVARNPDH